MLRDYYSIWVKWLALLNADDNLRRELLSDVHIEVTKGFDVVTRIAIEEIEGRVTKSASFLKAKEAITDYLAFSVWGGYMLFLIANQIDPQKNNLIARQTTNSLGNEWLKHYASDQNASLLKEVDPFYSMMLEKEAQSRINLLFAEYEGFMGLAYKETSTLETFLNWASHQGFIFGILEDRLNDKKTREGKDI